MPLRQLPLLALLPLASALQYGAPLALSRRPVLCARARLAPLANQLSVPSDDEQPERTTLRQRVAAALPPKSELQKMVPLTIMFFSILFSYTILRDTKDVLIVTAPGSSAEAIPFLKTWVNLPGAVAFTVAYSAMANKLGREALFYSTLAPFVAFFASFAWIIYPMRAVLHPTVLCDKLSLLLPLGFAAPIAVLRNWTFSVFYLLANMWGSVVVSLLFWGFANEVTTVEEAKKYYPLFGMGANVALVFSGQFVRYVSQLHTRLPAGTDPWGVALKLLMGAVAISGAVVAGCFRYINVAVLNKADAAAAKGMVGKPVKKKPSMGLRESAAYLAKSPYIRDLFVLVTAYGMSINIVEVTWKSKLKLAFPDPSAYSAFMGQFSSATGVVTLAAMLFGRFVFRKWGWGVAATITPTVLLATGATFFALILGGDFFSPLVAVLGTTPLMLAVIVGALQNILSKAAKYSLFDPCKEMAYIPLDQEQKTKGKAAIDVIGGPLGKSGGSLIQQVLIVAVGSLAAATPYLAVILTAIIGAWILAARSLSVQFEEAMSKQKPA
uniref:ADP,ATP carrier protein n=1 Tax=Prymnesium parvum TaxID=97485 RepID=E6Y2P4_PRYPA|nr:plastid ATP/ADP translocase [Prymnesium parvum]